MIKCNLAVLLAERGLKMSDVINETKLAKNTVRSLYYNEAKGIQFETLTTLCDFLDVDVGELLTKLHIKINYNSLKIVSDDAYTIGIEVISGYKKSAGQSYLLINKNSEYDSVELIIPSNIYHILSSFKHIEINYIKNELIFPILQTLNLSLNAKQFTVSVADSFDSDSEEWLSHHSYSRRSFLSEHPF